MWYATTAEEVLKTLHATLYGGCKLLFKLYDEEEILNLIEARPTPAQWAKHFTPVTDDFIIMKLQQQTLETQKLQHELNAIKRIHLIQIIEANRLADARYNLAEARIRELERQNHEYKLLIRCPVCLHTTKNAFLLCGHGCCRRCYNQLNACPLCKVTPEKIYTLFL